MIKLHKKNESILHIIKKIIIKKDTFKNLYILSLYKSWKIFSIYNLFLKIYNNRNLFFGDTSYVYFHIQFKIFDGGGGQLAPCFILSVPEKNHGADN